MKIEKNNKNITVVEKEIKIVTVADTLDIMATARHVDDSFGIVIYKESFCEDFFDLKTGFAGEVLQKFSTYDVRLAIVGDFSMYTSKALKDFIYECNQGNSIFWVDTLEKAIELLEK